MGFGDYLRIVVSSVLSPRFQTSEKPSNYLNQTYMYMYIHIIQHIKSLSCWFFPFKYGLVDI